MRAAILIMSADKEPSLRNVEAIKRTIIKQVSEGNFKHHYDFFIYNYSDTTLGYIQCIKDETYTNCYNIKLDGKESIFRTYEKTYLTYEYLLDNEKKFGRYDTFIRINISCFVNMRLLDAVLDKFEPDTIYTNVLNTYVNFEGPYYNELYARGDFYIVPHDTLIGILKNGKDLLYCDQAMDVKSRIEIPHVDDALFGYAFIRYKGKDQYYNKLKMLKYNFLPIPHTELTYIHANFNKMAISTRVKTTPPNTCSGYSWDDNELRKSEPYKIEIAYSMVNQEEYANINLEDILVSPLQERKTPFIQVLSLTPSQIIAITK